VVDVSGPSLGSRAREALGRHAWQEAYDLLAGADARGELAHDELDLLAQAAWWVGKLPVAIDARERAYAAALQADDPQAAVITAVTLARDNLFRNAHAVANAWLNRAERLLEGSEEGLGHGWLAATRAFHAALMGDTGRALAEAARALEIAERIGDTNLEAMARSEKGAALLARGDVEEGLALLDEATVAAVGGELEPTIAGGVCCTSIESCAALGDWQRAAAWTEAQDRWCRREGISGYPGMCRLFRAETKRVGGNWLEAEAEARRASEELAGYIPAAVGLALAQVGEIRLRRGDLPAAEEALLRAYGYGHPPEPALSLLRLAQGKGADAAASIRRALDDPVRMPSWMASPGSDLHRLRLLPAQVEIALAVGDADTARGAANELTELAERFATTAAGAAAAMARGAVALADGDAARAARELSAAVQRWTDLEAPYEAARARLLLAEALLAQDAADAAAMELHAARAAFERLGATPDLGRADRLLATLGGGDAPAGPPAVERAARAFMFTDIVDSTKLAETLGDDAWDGLLRWHDGMLRTLIAEHGGEEVKRTGDGFFVAFADAGDAIDAAVAVQRRLEAQRQAHGFAPAVRIGVHWAEARRAGLDYIGGGVNQAARICALAEGGQVLVSAETLTASRRTFPERGRRKATLKGISAPVEVADIAWR
jgi:class 3 adenylate cyclase